MPTCRCNRASFIRRSFFSPLEDKATRVKRERGKKHGRQRASRVLVSHSIASIKYFHLSVALATELIIISLR